MSPEEEEEEEERYVAALKADAEQGPRVETGAGAGLEPYRTLAESRGLSLEAVLRAAHRGELADVVALPPVNPRRRLTTGL